MEANPKKVYLLIQSLMNGSIVMESYYSVFSTEELAKKAEAAVNSANTANRIALGVRMITEVKEIDLYSNEDHVPILNKK